MRQPRRRRSLSVAVRMTRMTGRNAARRGRRTSLVHTRPRRRSVRTCSHVTSYIRHETSDNMAVDIRHVTSYIIHHT